eukprot:CAMPEP_0175044698 /NCGR_PEP_ID=MMETSP0052_2-20121109/3969_1 /TAXON_ID=51329 ORGANISM="Polytomella parva, Strain SAG 63-3" /NCGR_SAMPLE_ID=MMETSP0052_2 /ASSEMBLY_ACC=CAM_ASM_000194 /LENGTH=442 /DNA_ID=CAMNT_0016308061 /DNA_START=183 /DNA_END=1511 /DNA_ORIENTATION=-
MDISKLLTGHELRHLGVPLSSIQTNGMLSTNIDIKKECLEASIVACHTCVGSLLGLFCGDILGAPVEGLDASALRILHPEGIVYPLPWSNESLSSVSGSSSSLINPLKIGRFTDDSQMTLALTHSLLRCNGHCDAFDAAKAYAQAMDPKRGYGHTAVKVLTDIRNGASFLEARCKYLPHGSYGNGGAMRIAPVALVNSLQPMATMRSAVQAALAATHMHSVAIDGALAVAVAIRCIARWKLKLISEDDTDITDILLTPAELLRKVKAASETMEMKDKIDMILEKISMFPLHQSFGRVENQCWKDYWASEMGQLELGLSSKIGAPFQIRATDAAACALLALTWHWSKPRDVITAAVHYGGDTDTVAAIAGAMVGALYGVENWIPLAWWEVLENVENQKGKEEKEVEAYGTQNNGEEEEVKWDEGRDAMVRGAVQLSQLMLARR